MPEPPKITVSSLDLERLSTLLDCLSSLRHPQTPRLRQELSQACVVPAECLPFDTVAMNSWVRFRVLDNGSEFQRLLCYPADCLDRKEHLSILEPAGGALLGLSVGSRMAWVVAEGRLAEVEIVRVDYAPERLGE